MSGYFIEGFINGMKTMNSMQLDNLSVIHMQKQMDLDEAREKRMAIQDAATLENTKKQEELLPYQKLEAQNKAKVSTVEANNIETKTALENEEKRQDIQLKKTNEQNKNDLDKYTPTETARAKFGMEQNGNKVEMGMSSNEKGQKQTFIKQVTLSTGEVIPGTIIKPKSDGTKKGEWYYSKGLGKLVKVTETVVGEKGTTWAGVEKPTKVVDENGKEYHSENINQDVLNKNSQIYNSENEARKNGKKNGEMIYLMINGVKTKVKLK